MNKRAITTLLIALIVLQPLVLGVGAPSAIFQVVQTYFGSLGNPLEAGPGDKSVTFNVVVQNTGLETYSGLNAVLYLKFPFTNITGGNTVSSFFSGGIPVSQTATLQFQLNIDEGAQIGPYSTAMSLNYGAGLNLGETLFVPILLPGRAELNVSADPSFLPPGSTNVLMVEISNEGSGSASKVSVTLNFPLGLSVTGDNQWSFQNLKPNEHGTISLDIYAQPSLAGSSLQIGASITYNDAYGTSRSISRVIGLRILPLSNVPLVLSVEGGHLQPGTLNTIRLDIVNNQTRPVSSVQASLTLPGATGGTPPLVILGDNSWFFRSIGPLSSVTFNVTLMVSSSAANANYQLTLTLSYLDPFSVARTENHVFGVQVLSASENVLTVSVDDNILTAGSFNEPSITITNSGEATLSSIAVSLSISTFASQTTQNIILTTANQWNFDLLPPNDNITFPAKMFATLNAKDTSNQIQLSIKYNDGNGVNHAETISLGFVVKGAINFEIFNGQVIPRATYAGGNITITGDILNMGNTRALYTTVAAESSSVVQSLEGPTYIGEIDTNIQTPFSLSVRIRKTANNGTYPMTVAFNYEDDYGVAHTVKKIFNVTIGGFIPTTTPVQSRQNTTQQGILSLPVLIAIVVVVIILCIVLIYLRRRRHRK